MSKRWRVIHVKSKKMNPGHLAVPLKAIDGNAGVFRNLDPYSPDETPRGNSRKARRARKS